MPIRKEELIARLQALEGNPYVVLNQDGGEHWGNYVDNLDIAIEKVVPIEGEAVRPLQIGHPGGKCDYVNVEEDMAYIVLY